MRKMTMGLATLLVASLALLAFAPTTAAACSGACPPPEFAEIRCPAGYAAEWSIGEDGNCRLACLSEGP